MELLGNVNLQSIQNSDLQSLQDNFPSKPHFLSKWLEFYRKILSGHQFSLKAPFPPKSSFSIQNPFRISIFLQSLIFYSNATFPPLKSLQNVNFPYKPHFLPRHLFFYSRIISGHQFSIKDPLSTEPSLSDPTFPSDF